MPLKKKSTARVYTGRPKRVRIASKKLAVFGIVGLALAIPLTLSLVASSQDIRQEASETQIATTVITTMPTDTLKINISKEDGTTQKDNSGSQQNNSGDGSNDSNQNGDCVVRDTTEKTTGGMMRQIDINCDGENQQSNQSGSDGNQQINKSGGGQNGQISQPRGGSESKSAKNEKTGKAVKKEKGKKNLIQQFVEFIMGRQGR